MKALLVAVLALTGCYFKTRDTLVESPVSAPKVSTDVVPGGPDVVAKTRQNVISFRVEMRRQCVTQAVQNIEVLRGKKLDIGMSIWIIPAALVIPAVFVAVPVVSGVIAASRANKHERAVETRVISRNSYACPLRLAAQVVQVRFPSGAVSEASTDDRGIASVTIPDAEVDHGTARIELADVTRTIDYDRRGYDVEQLAIEVDE